MNIIKFIKDEWNHWINSRLDQGKFETESQLEEYKKLDDGSERIHYMIDDLEQKLANIRMRLAIRKENGHHE